MKCIISFIFITFIIISIITFSSSERDARKFRLSRVFQNINEEKSRKFQNNLYNEIIEATDVDCVKNFFNLPKNNKMIISQIEELNFKIAASLKCSDENKVFEKLLDETIPKKLQRRLNCMKWILQKLEPDSIFIENFKINENDITECNKRLSTDGIEELQNDLERTLGPLSVYSCGTVTGVDDFMKFLAKGALIRYENDEELKEAERKKLIDYVKEVAETTVKCNIKRYEEDPEAYSTNNSLNYYFNKYIEQTNLNQLNNQNSYLKEAAEIEAMIDQDCLKTNLNLPQNGNKSVLKIESTVLLTIAKAKCIKGDLLKFLDLFLNFTVTEYFNSDESVFCARYRLQKLEPVSKLVENAVINNTNCESFDVNIHPFGIYQRDYEKFVGPLNETTCGILTDEAVNLINFKTFLLANERNEELKRNEIKELFDYATEKLEKLGDCILEGDS